jgi:hypothetical protein
MILRSPSRSGVCPSPVGENLNEKSWKCPLDPIRRKLPYPIPSSRKLRLSGTTKPRAIVRILYFILPCLLFTSACKRFDNGDLLFEVTYPVVEFAIASGQPPFQTLVIAQPSIPTAFVDAMMEAAISADDIDLVGGFRARVVSLTGEDFSEIERIEIRACAVGTPRGCQTGTLFSIDDLFRRRQQTVNLNPSPGNFRDLFVGNDNVRIELIFSPGITTSRTIEARLEWTVGAFGNLE